MQSSKLQLKVQNIKKIILHSFVDLHFKRKRGYIAISMIVLIAAVVLAVSTTVSLLAIGEAQTGLTLQKGEDTWNFVDGCAEDALIKIWASSSYTGGTITRPEGTCSVTVTTGNPNWDITVTTTATTYKRSVRIQATRGSTITITSWQEI